eukprot:8895403-Pyramimonas_sp.AAC.1
MAPRAPQSKAPKRASTRPEEAPRGVQDAPKGLPRYLRKAPEIGPPRGPQNARRGDQKRHLRRL